MSGRTGAAQAAPGEIPTNVALTIDELVLIRWALEYLGDTGIPEARKLAAWMQYEAARARSVNRPN